MTDSMHVAAEAVRKTFSKRKESEEELASAMTASLHELGTNPDEVADMLAKWHVMGKKQDPCNCPVSNWLSLRIHRWGKFAVGVPKKGLAVKPEKPEDVTCKYVPIIDAQIIDTSSVEVPLPQAVATFLARFDQGHYPHLDLATREETLKLTKPY